MIERAVVEDGKDMYEVMLKMSKMVDMMYEAHERREKEEAESDASSTSSSEYSMASLYSHHLNEEINHSLQADNFKLKVILREEKEDKKREQLQLQAIEESLEEIKHDNQSLQAKDVELRRLLQEEKEDK